MTVVTDLTLGCGYMSYDILYNGMQVRSRMHTGTTGVTIDDSVVN